MLSCPGDDEDDPVDRASLESFPASDPPAWIFQPRVSGPKRAHAPPVDGGTIAESKQPEGKRPREPVSGDKGDD